MQSSNYADANQGSVSFDAAASAVAQVRLHDARIRDFLGDGGLDPLGCTKEQHMAELEAVKAQIDEAFGTEGVDCASVMAQDDDLHSVGGTFCFEDLLAADIASSNDDYIDVSGSPAFDCSLYVEGSSTVDGSIYLEGSPDVKGSSPEVEDTSLRNGFAVSRVRFPSTTNSLSGLHIPPCSNDQLAAATREPAL